MRKEGGTLFRWAFIPFFPYRPPLVLLLLLGLGKEVHRSPLSTCPRLRLERASGSTVPAGCQALPLQGEQSGRYFHHKICRHLCNVNRFTGLREDGRVRLPSSKRGSAVSRLPSTARLLTPRLTLVPATVVSFPSLSTSMPHPGSTCADALPCSAAIVPDGPDPFFLSSLARTLVLLLSALSL